MGTNYYLYTKCCPTCGIRQKIEHIGKSSGGWSFSFHACEEAHSWQEWKKYILSDPSYEILDEYGHLISMQDLEKLVESKKDGINHSRLFLGIDLTDKEMEYLERYPNTTRYIGDEYIRSIYLDPEGHSFSKGEFA